MIIKLLQHVGAHPPGHLFHLRCPSCHRGGTFDKYEAQDIQGQIPQEEGPALTYILGQRHCPNPACQAHIFFVYNHNLGALEATYPAERIDFDATNLPTPVLAALEEAITCHANQCYVAAAIMIRKTLEQLCTDRGAGGSNLKERIKQLGGKVILPQELLDGLQELRLLGNDAAHIESQNYNKVELEEVELAIDITKEVLKSVYQYSALMDRLKALKKPPTP